MDETQAQIFPRSSRLLALSILFVSALSIWTNAFYPRQMDFISFWAASVLALGGNAAGAYDIEVHKAVQNGVELFDPLMPFPYPPPFLVMIFPIGLLPYAVAAAVWIAGTYTLYFAAAKRLFPECCWLIAAFPPVLLNAIMGQNGLLTAAIFIGGAVLLPKRPFVAGLLFGCLIIKPQLGLLLPFAFIAARQWRAFTGAAASSLGLLLLGLLFFGAGAYEAMAKLMPLYSSIAADGLVGWHKMSSVYGSLSLAGMPAQIAGTGHAVVAAAAFVAVWRIWRLPVEASAKTAALAAASILVSPYLYVYDTVVLVLPFLWLAGREKTLRLLALLWCLPLISIAQYWGYNETVNLMPLVPIVLLHLICRQVFGSSVRLPIQARLAQQPQ